MGGGKLSRQKYHDKAMQCVTSSLSQLDYVEDRGASCLLECGGCYKTQHDTGKNVFTVVVFPRVVAVSVGEKGAADGVVAHEHCDDHPLLPLDSPGYKMAVCTLKPTFQNLLMTHCPTYTEKKECLKCLSGLIQLEQSLETKMTDGHCLDGGEQSFYDESSELKEKYEFTQGEANRHIEEGRLTLEEKRLLLDMNQKRIETLMSEQNSALVAKKLKKALHRKEQLQTINDEVNSISAPPLRHEDRIFMLRKKLLSVQAIEDSSRGRLLSLDETRALTEKMKIESEIERLEVSSRGWFEEEEAFSIRLQRSRERCRRQKQNVGIKSTASGGPIVSASAVNQWILPGERPSKAWERPTKSKLKGKGGAVFTAMMMDSSSDDDDDDNSNNIEGEQLHEDDVTAKDMELRVGTKTQNQDVKKKKKSKGKHTKKKKVYDSEESPTSTSLVSASLSEFWQTLILPVLISFLSLIRSLVVSMFLKKEPKQ